jgi:hypothetical protein
MCWDVGCWILDIGYWMLDVRDRRYEIGDGRLEVWQWVAVGGNGLEWVGRCGSCGRDGRVCGLNSQQVK